MSLSLNLFKGLAFCGYQNVPFYKLFLFSAVRTDPSLIAGQGVISDTLGKIKNKLNSFCFVGFSND